MAWQFEALRSNTKTGRPFPRVVKAIRKGESFFILLKV